MRIKIPRKLRKQLKKYKYVLSLVPVAIVALVLIIWLYHPTFLISSVKRNSEDTKAFIEQLPRIKHRLDTVAWQQYTELVEEEDEEIIDLVFEALLESRTDKEFAHRFKGLIDESYLRGYPLHLAVDKNLGGLRGTMHLKGDVVPDEAYAFIKLFDKKNKLLETVVTPVQNGIGYYNFYGKTPAVRMECFVASDNGAKTVLTATENYELQSVHLPEVFITEISNQHTTTYYSDLVADREHRGSQEQKFQYIELYNYTDVPVDLKEYSFVYTDHQGDHRFNWITEKDGSTVLAPKTTYVIGVYSADSVLAGYGYKSDGELKKYWADFAEFYNTEIPVTNRTMIACVASGQASKMLDGIDHLERSADAGVTVRAEIRKGGTAICVANLKDDMPSNSYAYQFLPDTDVQADFLYVTGCFPGKLLDVQDLAYCSAVRPEGKTVCTVASYNILATDKNPAPTKTTVKGRSEYFLRFMEDTKPDIIGLQEVNYRWAPILSKKMYDLGYGEVQGISSHNHTYDDVSTTNQWDLMNPIYYNAERFKVMESGHEFLTDDGSEKTEQWDSVNLRRSYTYVVLKDKQNGQIYTHLNTHLVLSGKVARVRQVQRICEKARRLQTKYGGSIVITGDHNMSENSEPYQAYINAGLVDAKYHAADRDSVGTFTDFDTKYNATYGSPIDFCFVNAELGVDSYRVFDGKYADGIVSDHSAVIVKMYK